MDTATGEYYVGSLTQCALDGRTVERLNGWAVGRLTRLTADPVARRGYSTVTVCVTLLVCPFVSVTVSTTSWVPPFA